MPFGLSQSDLMGYLVRLFIIFLILPIHEFAHAWTAYKLGDETAKYQGRLTLNPIAHIDPIGAICLLIGGFGWAKPVPIDPSRFTRKHSVRFGVAITALAGPVSNLIVAFLGMIGLRIFECTSYYNNYWNDMAAGEAISNAPDMIDSMLYAFVLINIGLAVFNLIPIPPLDGSKILGYFTSAKVDRWFIRNEQIIRIVFLVVLVSPILHGPLNFVEGQIFRLFTFLTNWIPAIMG